MDELFPKLKRPGRPRQFSVRLTVEQEALLSELAKRTGLGKADMIREALQLWVESGPHAKVTQEIVKKKASK